MFEYTKLPNTIRYDLPSWPGFYVLAVPDPNAENHYTLYLTHDNFGVIHFLFGGTFDNLEDVVEAAHWNAADYLPDFVRDCCTDETE